MTLEEYKKSLGLLEAEFSEKKITLAIEYAASQRKFRIGDIIKDNSVTIKIDSFTTYLALSEPAPVYKGQILRKDLKRRKDGERGRIFGNKNAELIQNA